MAYNVQIAETDFEFDVEPGETVLDAAERQGFALPYSCRKGVCNTCKGGLTSGDVGVRGKGDVSGPATGVLLCQARPQSDITISPSSVEKVDPIRRRTVPARIRRKELVAADVVRLSLRFPIGTRVPFSAGQYLRVTLGQGMTRNYSMANAPRKNDGCELHIRVIDGGRFSQQALGALGTGDVLTVEMPFGTFGVDRSLQRPAILLAGGTGYAPIRSVIEAQVDEHTRRPLHLYWGARNRDGLYDLDRLTELAKRHDWFTFTPVLSEPDEGWTGRTGLVHRAALADHPDLSAHEVYACGAPAMIDAAEAEFCSDGNLDPAAFHADAFLATEEPVPASAAQPTSEDNSS
ncbi:2Fe-2S iron-sulfur cluster-binding protein [Anianabacter salinae]|uniref:2Fe-2S iron-sulfur cluster-binding protein n=1 Tax=Anianabacter salinae TaxID=2851023 RepID=UPI00225DD53B|nr:2Fe-2S iron-sulfur cluster-binding protein [Anianabacter salinae]MBV0913825.1 2Fe-2S iron-sulfur cluster binding domain-containing protein [Anianabacter salinae]